MDGGFLTAAVSLVEEVDSLSCLRSVSHFAREDFSSAARWKEIGGNHAVL